MKKLILFLSLIFLFSFITLSINKAEARSGCCSWHGGVCGCRCCDGTPLSAKCAPYYPQCNNKTTPKYTPSTPEYNPPIQEEYTPKTDTPKTDTPKTDTPKTDTPKTDMPSSYTAEFPKNNNLSIWWWIIGVSIITYIFYQIGKRKSD